MLTQIGDKEVIPVEMELVQVQGIQPYMGLHRLNAEGADFLRRGGSLGYLVLSDLQTLLVGNNRLYGLFKNVGLSSLDQAEKRALTVGFRFDPGYLEQFQHKQIITESGTCYGVGQNYELHGRPEHSGARIELLAGVDEDSYRHLKILAGDPESFTKYIEACGKEPRRGLRLAILTNHREKPGLITSPIRFIDRL